MNEEKYSLQTCHLLILHFLCVCVFFVFVFAVGTETSALVFPVRLLGSQLCCHFSVTVWARKMFDLNGIKGIL